MMLSAVESYELQLQHLTYQLTPTMYANDEHYNESDADEPVEDTVLTPELLRGDCPDTFTVFGRTFTCEEQTTWYNDEYVPQEYEIADHDWTICFSMAPVDGGPPTLLDVLEEVHGWVEVNNGPTEFSAAQTRTMLTAAYQNALVRKAEYEKKLAESVALVEQLAAQLAALPPETAALGDTVATILTSNDV